MFDANPGHQMAEITPATDPGGLTVLRCTAAHTATKTWICDGATWRKQD